MKKYIIKYWLPGQSKEFTYPQTISVDSCEELKNLLMGIKYEIESINILEVKDER